MLAPPPCGNAIHTLRSILPQERQDVMKAAAGAVEQDGRMQDWGKRLLEIQESLQSIHERMTGEAALGDDGGKQSDDESGDDLSEAAGA